MLQPEDDKLYRAVLNLQINKDFEVVRSYLVRRFSEEAGQFAQIDEDVRLRKCQGRSAAFADLAKKFNPKNAREELEKLEKRVRESQASTKIF